MKLFAKRPAHPTQAELSAFLDGQLASARLDAIAVHLQSCEACSVALDGLRATKAALAALPRPAASRSFSLGPEYAREPIRRAAAPRSPWVFAPAVSMTVLLILVAVDLGGGRGLNSSPADLSAGEAAQERLTASAPEPLLQPSTTADGSTDGSLSRSAPAAAPTVGGAAQNPVPNAAPGSVPTAGGASQDTVPSGAIVPVPSARSAAEGTAPADAEAPAAASATEGLSSSSAPPAPATGGVSPGVTPAPPTLAATPITSPGGAAVPIPTTSVAAQGFSAPTPPAVAPQSQAKTADDAAADPTADGGLANTAPAEMDTDWLRVLQVAAFLAFVVSLIAVVGSRGRRRGEPNR